MGSWGEGEQGSRGAGEQGRLGDWETGRLVGSGPPVPPSPRPLVPQSPGLPVSVWGLTIEGKHPSGGNEKGGR